MTPKQQRIAIAEACGWKRIPVDAVDSIARLFYGDIWWRDAESNTVGSISQLPDYLEDLNAMHEAEKVLQEHQFRAYLDWLDVECGGEIELSAMVEGPAFAFGLVHATASQRAKAMLRALDLWKD